MLDEHQYKIEGKDVHISFTDTITIETDRYYASEYTLYYAFIIFYAKDPDYRKAPRFFEDARYMRCYGCRKRSRGYYYVEGHSINICPRCLQSIKAIDVYLGEDGIYYFSHNKYSNNQIFKGITSIYAIKYVKEDCLCLYKKNITTIEKFTRNLYENKLFPQCVWCGHTGIYKYSKVNLHGKIELERGYRRGICDACNSFRNKILLEICISFSLNDIFPKELNMYILYTVLS